MIYYLDFTNLRCVNSELYGMLFHTMEELKDYMKNEPIKKECVFVVPQHLEECKNLYVVFNDANLTIRFEKTAKFGENYDFVALKMECCIWAKI